MPENDRGHNGENHLNQMSNSEEGEAGESGGEMGGNSAAGSGALAAKKRPAPVAEDGGDPVGAPAAKKRPSCCSVCRQPGHQKPKCPDLEFADAAPPKPTLNVMEDQVIRCWDIESDARTKVVYESGSCLTKFTNQGWHDIPGELKAVLHHTTVSDWCSDNCDGLAAECAASTTTLRQAMDEDTQFIKDHEVKIIKAHNGLSSDTLILCKHGAREGINVLAEWKEAGIVGLLDPAVVIPKYNIIELQHPPDARHQNHWSYLSNGALYEKATGKTMEEDPQLSHHRALDDSKAERTWMQKLQPMTDLLFGEGAQQRPSVISIDDLQLWFAQKQKHAAYKARKALE